MKKIRTIYVGAALLTGTLAISSTANAALTTAEKNEISQSCIADHTLYPVKGWFGWSHGKYSSKTPLALRAEAHAKIKILQQEIVVKYNDYRASWLKWWYPDTINLQNAIAIHGTTFLACDLVEDTLTYPKFNEVPEYANMKQEDKDHLLDTISLRVRGETNSD